MQSILEKSLYSCSKETQLHYKQPHTYPIKQTIETKAHVTSMLPTLANKRLNAMEIITGTYDTTLVK
jgi:hypothetical protein